MIRALPTTAICLCCLWLAVDEGGFYVPTWSAVAAAAAALALALSLAVWRLRAHLTGAARVAAAGLVTLTAWSFLSALWALAPGSAWNGSLLGALYLVALLVPLLWPASDAARERILLGIALAVAGLGGVGVARAVADPASLVYARLAWPSGYPNATAALFALAAWLALVV